MDNQRIMKAITSQDNLRQAGQGGLLLPDVADKFIDYLVDKTSIIKAATTYRINGDSRRLDTISVNQRVVRKGTEAVDPGFTVGVGTGKREVTTEEVVLPFDITFQFLEDNIEKENVEDHIAQLMSGQLANDLEDLGINGDAASADPFVSIKDGWLKILDTDAATHKYDTNASTDYKGVVFPNMLSALPEQWKRNYTGLCYCVAPSVEEAYRFQVTSRATGLGDDVLQNGSQVSFVGIPVIKTPLMPAGTHLLCRRENLVFAIKRAIHIGRFVNERKRQIEYTVSTRIGYQVINPDQIVVAADYV